MSVTTAADDADLRGSAPVMSAKDLILEVYRDMKFVRPAVESLLAAGVIARIEKLEDDAKARAAAGEERRRIGTLTNKALGVVIVICNFILGILVVVANILSQHTTVLTH